MSLLEIVYPNKFSQLTHAKILGTVLNRLGIERKLFGDILVTDQRAQIVVNQNFKNLFEDGIQKVSKISVSLEERSFSEKVVPRENYYKRMSWFQACVWTLFYPMF